MVYQLALLDGEGHVVREHGHTRWVITKYAPEHKVLSNSGQHHAAESVCCTQPDQVGVHTACTSHKAGDGSERVTVAVYAGRKYHVALSVMQLVQQSLRMGG